MNMNANDIPIFASVAEHKGITAAANYLGIPKSTVSNAINRLEKAMGVRLLERNSRNIRLTSEGESFYKHSQIITEHLELAEAEMSGLQREPRGKLSIALTMAFSREIVKGQLTEFMQKYPEIQLDIHVSNDYKIDVISDPVDVAIKVGELPDSELIVTKLMQAPLIWVSSPAYSKSHVFNEEQISSHIKIIDKRYTKLDLSMKKGRIRKAINFKNISVSNDPLMVRDLIVSGEGVGLVPSIFCQDQIQNGELELLLPDWSVEPESIISAVYPSRRLVSAKTKLLIDFLKEIINRKC